MVCLDTLDVSSIFDCDIIVSNYSKWLKYTLITLGKNINCTESTPYYPKLHPRTTPAASVMPADVIYDEMVKWQSQLCGTARIKRAFALIKFGRTSSI